MNLTHYFSLSLSAILIENFIFVKFLGCCPFFGVSKKTDTALGMGVAVTFVMTVASAVTNLINTYILKENFAYMRTVAFILVIASLVQFIEMFLMKSMPSLYDSLGIYLPLITTNCAVLGVANLNVSNGYDFISSVIYGFSAGIGFTLALVLFASVREKLEYADYPKCFTGFPIALVAASLLSIAFMGFQGLKVF